jgi:hypothetical protein
VKTPEDRLALAYDMLQKADESDGDPAAQYVLMERARVMTLMAGDPGRAVEIAERMGRRFELDVLALKLDTLRDSIKENAAPAPRARDLGECVLQLMEQLAFAERYDAAVELGSAYRDPPGKAFNAASARRVAALVKLLRDGEPQRSGAAAASEVLKAGRNDPAAAATVGRYLCFYRGDWVTGVPRLAKGDDATLKSLAQMEQGPTSTAADRMRLGDAWFDQAEKERNRTMQFVYYRRARHWYLSCAQALSGLERSRVQARIDRIGQMGE